MTTGTEAVEPEVTNYQIPAEHIIESLQRQIGNLTANNALEVAKLQAIVSGLQSDLKSARQLIDELLAMKAARDEADAQLPMEGDLANGHGAVSE